MTGFNPARYDLASLRLFIETVDAGSLTAGARRYGISVPAASKRLSELEAAAGVPLLERGRHGARPTPAGQTLYRYAVQVASDVAQMASAMNDFARGIRGHVRVWANTSAVNGFLPDLLRQFLDTHPQVAVDLEESNSEPTVAALLDGHADIGVFADNIPHSGLSVSVCDVDRLVLITPPGHPLARRRRVRFVDVLDHDLVGLDRTSSLMRLMRAQAEAHGRDLRLRVQVRSFDAMCRLVRTGLGLGILPHAGAIDHVASMALRLVAIDEDWAHRRLLVGWRGEETLTRPGLRLLQALKARTLSGESGDLNRTT